MNAVKTINYRNYTIEIIHDEHIENPRKEFDHVGTMVCFHNRHNIGDDHDFYDADEAQEFLKKNKDTIISLPLYLYDHSGITMKTSSFSCQWDSGCVGFIYVTKEKAKKEFNFKTLTKKNLQKVIDCLIAEVKEYDDYLTGNVYGFNVYGFNGFMVKDNNGNELYSCWGFYGDYDTSGIIDEAKSAIDYEIQSTRKKHFKQLKAWIKSKVNLQYRKPLCI